MTAIVSTGEIIPLPHPEHGRVADFAAVRVRLDEPPALPPEADLSNVIRFVRTNDNAPAPAVELPDDIAASHRASLADGQVHRAAVMALSLVIHSGLAMLLWHEAPPLASIGMEVMSVEITLGATAPAGVAPTPGETETPSASAPDEKSTETEKAEQKATEQPQEVQVAEKETAPEVKTETPPGQPASADPTPAATAETAPVDTAPAETVPTETAQTAAPGETAPVETPVAQSPTEEPKPSVAMAETPEAETATAKPTETPPDAVNFSMLPPPQTKPSETPPIAKKPVEKKPEAKPTRAAAPPKLVSQAAPSPERRRFDAPTRQRPSPQTRAAVASSRANNVGVGRSHNDSNYRGLVAAHLARHKQYPADARSRGDQGTATVSFSLDGSGRVTSVRLSRASGFGSIDTEVTAMVRRASPFPAPPSGQSVSFTVPVSFRMN
ncbi:MAG: periplasmic protein TonB [Variibacter sp.]|nr:periplasmic protein TonB [Variibacter sp.]